MDTHSTYPLIRFALRARTWEGTFAFEGCQFGDEMCWLENRIRVQRNPKCLRLLSPLFRRGRGWREGHRTQVGQLANFHSLRVGSGLPSSFHKTSRI